MYKINFVFYLVICYLNLIYVYSIYFIFRTKLALMLTNEHTTLQNYILSLELKGLDLYRQNSRKQQLYSSYGTTFNYKLDN